MPGEVSDASLAAKIVPYHPADRATVLQGTANPQGLHATLAQLWAAYDPRHLVLILGCAPGLASPCHPAEVRMAWPWIQAPGPGWSTVVCLLTHLFAPPRPSDLRVTQ